MIDMTSRGLTEVSSRWPWSCWVRCSGAAQWGGARELLGRCSGGARWGARELLSEVVLGSCSMRCSRAAQWGGARELLSEVVLGSCSVRWCSGDAQWGAREMLSEVLGSCSVRWCSGAAQWGGARELLSEVVLGSCSVRCSGAARSARTRPGAAWPPLMKPATQRDLLTAAVSSNELLPIRSRLTPNLLIN